MPRMWRHQSSLQAEIHGTSEKEGLVENLNGLLSSPELHSAEMDGLSFPLQTTNFQGEAYEFAFLNVLLKKKLYSDFRQ